MDLDIACTLALLQEEADVARRHKYKRSNSHFKSRTQGVPVPLPPPPPPKVLFGPAYGAASQQNKALMVPNGSLMTNLS
jgi:hypothetical protein